MEQRSPSFFAWLLGPFFRWWWAVATGLASLLAFIWTPPTGFRISRTGMLLLAFLVFTLLFLVLSVIAQGYRLFRERYRDLEVVALQKSTESGVVFIFLLRGHLYDATGQLIEIRRPIEDDEVSFAIVRVTGLTAKGLYQAIPVWISAGHLREFTSGKFSASVLVVRRHMYFEHARNIFQHVIAGEASDELG